ncbi:MAG: NAD(P)H-hydrate epimerase [Clostridium sp.]
MRSARQQSIQEAPCDIILDAVFGIGLGREIGGEYRKVLEMLASLREQYGTGVIAVDHAVRDPWNDR